MRKSNREITDFNEIVQVLKGCNVCRVALNDTDGTPYIVPVNFAVGVDGDHVTLYFHSALEGHKLDLVARDARAAFEMDRGHQLQYSRERGYCTFAYESVMGKGTVRMIEDEKEKVRALDAIMAQYHPEGDAPYNPAAIPRTVVWCLDVTEMTGKRKPLKPGM